MRSPNHPRFVRALRAFLLVAAVCCLLPLLLQAESAGAAGVLPATARQVRVGLDNSLQSAGVHCGSGFTVGVSAEDGRGFEARSSLGNASLRVSIDGGVISLKDTATGQTLYTHTSPRPLALRGANGQPITLNEREYPGFLEIAPFEGGFRVVNVVELETYVKCVMGPEIGTNHPKETRKAFSVLVRTFPMTTTKHASKGYDVCSTTCCQAYRGNFRRDPENDMLVDSTKGEYIAYEGAPAKCFYHDGNGGASCSAVAAWGGTALPYLTSVSLPEDEENASKTWQYVFTKEELFDFLSSLDAFRGLEDGVSSVEITETDPYGSDYVTLLSVKDENDNLFSVSTSDRVRTTLRFSSANFKVSYTMEANVVGGDGTVSRQTVAGYLDGNGEFQAFDSFEEFPLAGSESAVGADHITFDGVGSGHGVGLSVAGADQLASEGYSYRYLIAFYFEGTEIKKLP